MKKANFTSLHVAQKITLGVKKLATFSHSLEPMYNSLPVFSSGDSAVSSCLGGESKIGLHVGDHLFSIHGTVIFKMSRTTSLKLIPI